AAVRRAIGNRAGDVELNLRTCRGSAPDIQPATNPPRTFAHALQTIVARAAILQCFGLNSVAIVTNANPEGPIPVDDFSLDVAGTGMGERVAECLAHDAVHLVAKDRIQVSRRAFDDDTERG